MLSLGILPKGQEPLSRSPFLESALKSEAGSTATPATSPQGDKQWGGLLESLTSGSMGWPRTSQKRIQLGESSPGRLPEGRSPAAEPAG